MESLPFQHQIQRDDPSSGKENDSIFEGEHPVLDDTEYEFDSKPENNKHAIASDKVPKITSAAQ